MTDQLTDAELSAAVAEKVAGWREILSDSSGSSTGYLGKGGLAIIPRYATDANEVLTLLRKAGYVSANLNPFNGEWKVEILNGKLFVAMADTFARAACLALLRSVPPTP